MKKYNTLAMLVFVSFLLMGMSSPADDDIKATDESQKLTHNRSDYSKPHAGIELQYKLPKNIQPGESIVIELVFTVREQAEQLAVKVIHDNTLQLNAHAEFEFDTSKHKKNKASLALTTLQEGRSLIDLSATILVNGKHQSRSFTIPLIIGDSTYSKSNFRRAEGVDYKIDKTHGVVSMPAVETAQ